MPKGQGRTDIDDAREQIEVWLKSGMSRMEICRHFNCKYDTLYKRLERWDLLEYKNPGGKGRRVPWNKRKIADYLVSSGPVISSHKLKHWLWIEGMKPRQCEDCGWARMSVDGRLPLELDHVDGDHYNNELSNLRIRCPNCHALQPSSGGWNKGHRARVLVAQLAEVPS